MTENIAGSKLEVRLNGVVVGHLHIIERNGFYFQYDSDYTKNPDAIPLSTKEPTNETPWSERSTLRWFNGLLPEYDRRSRLAESLGIASKDTLSLLRAAGSECAGAVQIVEPGHKETPRLDPITHTAIGELLESLKLRKQAIEKEHRAAKLSLAGAQNKLVLHQNADGQWSLPLDGQPSTHILKPENEKYPGLIENENWCMTVLSYAGFNVAKTSVEDFEGTRALTVERYDRSYGRDGKIKRLHQEDLAQALGSLAKYQDEGGIDVQALASIQGVHPPELFDRIILNWLFGNCDAHAKNYSILEPGTSQAQLAPIYDFLSTEAYPDLGTRMAFAIGKAGEGKDVYPKDIDRLGETLGIEPGKAINRAYGIGERVRAAVEKAERENVDRGSVKSDKILRRCNTLRTWKVTRSGEPAKSPPAAPTHTAAKRAAELIGTPATRQSRIPQKIERDLDR